MIYANDIFNHEASVWIQANAGSGKTTALTNRYISLLINGFSHENTYCITYTNNGANEMKDRVLKKLKHWSDLEEFKVCEELKKIFTNPTKEQIFKAKNLFKEIVSSLKDLKISTIHSLCQLIISDLNLKIITQEDLNEVLEETVSIFEKSKITLEEEASYEFLIKTYSYSYTIDLIKEILKEYYLYIDKLSTKETLKKSYFVKEFNEFSPTQSQDLDELLEILFTQKGDIRKKLKIQNPEKLELLHQEFLTTKHNQLINNLIPCLSKMIEIFADIKQKNNFTTFNELLVLAQKKLKENDFSDIKLYLDINISHILIDEAQDTNPISWDIIKEITKDFFSGNSTQDFTKTIFIVGDAKQSIFSFQGSNVEFYQSQENYFKKQSENASIKFINSSLNTTYRCNKDILAIADRLANHESFKEAFLENSTHIAHNDIPSTITHTTIEQEIEEKKDEEIDWIKLHHLPKEEGETHIDKISEKIKDTIVSSLKEDPKTTFLILFPTRTGQKDALNNIITNLIKNNVQISGIDKINIQQSMAFHDIIMILKAISNPLFDDSFLCVLRGPLFEIEHDKVINLIRRRNEENKDLSIFEFIESFNENLFQDNDDLEFLNAVSLIKTYCNEFKFSNPRDAIIELFLKDEFYTKMNQEYSLHFFKVAKIITEKLKSIGMIDSFSLDNVIQSIQNISSSQDNQDRSYQIQLSTIHSSKGSEADVVILIENTAGFIEQNKKHNKLVLTDENLYVYHESIAKIKKMQNFIEAKKQKSYQEKARLLYVAITRAKKQFHVITTNKIHEEESYSKFLSTII